MKQLLFLFVSVFIFSGCQPSAEESAESSASTPEAALPAVTTEDGVRVVRMTGNDRMHYNLESFEVQPGQTVRLTLTNIGKMPKGSMGHNVVIVQPGTNLNTFAGAAALEKANGYLPSDAVESILAHTALLGPGETDTIEFTAPETTGVYPFLCSFPAHLFAGMKGEMVVVE